MKENLYIYIILKTKSNVSPFMPIIELEKKLYI